MSHRADGQRRRRHRWREERIEAGEEAGDPAAEALDVLHGEQPRSPSGVWVV
jgi:hypothetical protein